MLTKNRKKIAKHHEKATKKIYRREANINMLESQDFDLKSAALHQNKSQAFSQLSALFLKLSLCVALLSRSMFILRKSMRKFQNIAKTS